MYARVWRLFVTIGLVLLTFGGLFGSSRAQQGPGLTAPSPIPSPGAQQAPSGGGAIDQKVGKAVTDALAADGSVFVVVALTEPAAAKAEKVEVDALKSDVASLRSSVLAGVAPAEFRETKRFEAVPALAGVITPTGPRSWPRTRTSAGSTSPRAARVI